MTQPPLPCLNSARMCSMHCALRESVQAQAAQFDGRQRFGCGWRGAGHARAVPLSRQAPQKAKACSRRSAAARAMPNRSALCPQCESGINAKSLRESRLRPKRCQASRIAPPAPLAASARTAHQSQTPVNHHAIASTMASAATATASNESGGTARSRPKSSRSSRPRRSPSQSRRRAGFSRVRTWPCSQRLALRPDFFG